VKVALGFDHRGVRLRETVIAAVAEAGHEPVDLGVDTDAVRVDYPNTARAVGDAILAGRAERGILVCGSGAGVSIAATKIRGIRAAMCHDSYSAHQAVEHDDMNVLCLGSEIVGPSLAAELVTRFLAATFVGEGRYLARLKMVEELEGLVDG
jgi:ribose 5-phosphate isomerase B